MPDPNATRAVRAAAAERGAGSGGLAGFWKLTWVEIKVFVREPMGVIGTLVIPVLLFLVLGSLLDPGAGAGSAGPPFNVAVLAAVFIAINAVLSLVAVVSIYREGGILKRLRATPLSPLTILGSHVAVKLLFTGVGLTLLFVAGKQFFPGLLGMNVLSFGAALLVSTLSILSIGFLIASLVPTARFAQPIGSVVLYPMLAVSGLFFPLELLPAGWQAFARLLPTTHAVSLMDGIWKGEGWAAHGPDVLGLVAVFVVFSAVSARVFRWE